MFRRYVWSNGDWYQGEWAAGCRHGAGTYVWKEKNEKYDPRLSTQRHIAHIYTYCMRSSFSIYPYIHLSMKCLSIFSNTNLCDSL